MHSTESHFRYDDCGKIRIELRNHFAIDIYPTNNWDRELEFSQMWNRLRLTFCTLRLHEFYIFGFDNRFFSFHAHQPQSCDTLVLQPADFLTSGGEQFSSCETNFITRVHFPSILLSDLRRSHEQPRRPHRGLFLTRLQIRHIRFIGWPGARMECRHRLQGDLHYPDTFF